MATDIDGLMGLDSLSSLNQETNILLARSNSSASSLDDVIGGHQPRKKKSNTLNRLRKLKKPAELHQHKDGLSSMPPIGEITKDLSKLQLAKQINGNNTEIKDRENETKQTLQDGKEEISSLMSRQRDALNKKPLPSPRIKPHRIRPLDGTLDALDDSGDLAAKHNKSDTEIHPSSFAKLPRASPFDGGSDLEDSHVKNGNVNTNLERQKDSTYNSSSNFTTETSLSKVRPRRFVNHEESMMGYNAAEMRISKEQTEKLSGGSKLKHKSDKSEMNNRILEPVLSSTERVSSLPPFDLSQKEVNKRNDIKQLSDNLTESDNVQKLSTVTSTIHQNFEIVSGAKISSNEIPEDVNFEEDSDSEDLVVVPDNSLKKTINETKSNRTSNVTEAVRRISADGQSDSLEISSSISSLTDVSKLMSPASASTPTKTNRRSDAETNHKSSLPSSDDDDDDDEDIVVSTFANKKEVEEIILPTSVPREESFRKHLSSEELAAELNQLSEDETLQRYTQSLQEDISNKSLQDDVEISNMRNLEQTQLEDNDRTKESRNDRPTPLIIEHPPPPQSSDFASTSNTSYHEDADNSVAMSEPILGGNSFCLDTNHSFRSTGALSLITTRSARNKSFLTGGASTTGSLMSKDELERFFPDRKVKIFIVTWNMCEGKVLPDNLEELLLPEDCVLVQDMYVIGTQESGSDGQEWEIRLQETLGPSHVLLHSATYGVLRLLIFIRRDLIWFCSAVEEDTVSTRAFSVIKTKGAVAASFTFFGTSFLFINSHFAAGDEQSKERIADYNKIIKELQLPVKVPPTRKYNNVNTDVTTRFDCIFWCGDFNFRLAENRTKVENWAGKLRDGKDDNYDILLQHDQLKKAMEKKMVFRGFHEGEIKFLPTYKYDIGGDIYDTSLKARVPSYTDRVLCKSRRSAQIHSVLYNACNCIKTSDHKPVYAMYEASIRPGKDDSLTSGGVFSRDVFIEANKRRAAKAAMSGAVMSQKSSTVCSVM